MQNKKEANKQSKKVREKEENPIYKEDKHKKNLRLERLIHNRLLPKLGGSYMYLYDLYL